jgi:predicted HTH transcriptional regulator
VPSQLGLNGNAFGGLLVFGVSRQGKVIGCDSSRDSDTIFYSPTEILTPVKCTVLDVKIKQKYVIVLVVPPAEKSKSIATVVDREHSDIYRA